MLSFGGIISLLEMKSCYLPLKKKRTKKMSRMMTENGKEHPPVPKIFFRVRESRKEKKLTLKEDCFLS